MAERVEAQKVASIGAMIDRRFKLVAAKAAIDRKLADAKKALDDIEAAILEQLKAGKLEGARGKAGMVTKGMLDTPKIEDFDKLKKHILATGHLDLLQKRLTATAVRERWDAEDQVPGVGHYTEVTLHWTATKS